MKRTQRRRGLLAAATALIVGMSTITAGTAVAAPAPETPPTSSPTTSTSTAPAVSTANPWALKPYMGWSTYSMQVLKGGAWMTGDQVIAQSDAMKAKLGSSGYKYINMDAGWNDGFDDYGRPVPSAKRFPQGFEKVVDHIHKNGQKAGIYLIPGLGKDLYEANKPILGGGGCTARDIAKKPLTQGDYWGYTYQVDFTNPCAQKWVDSSADKVKSWGIDFVKFDSVTPGSTVTDKAIEARDDVAAWSSALKRNKIWFEISWALDIKYADYWREKADGWRVDTDVECYCGDEALTQWQNIARLFPKVADWWRYAGNGGWNDLDSLDVGNGEMDGLTKDERKTAATLWAASAAPFYTGNDLTDLDDYGLSLLTNPEVIAVDQAGTPSRPVSTATNQQAWYALQADGSYTVALYNLGRTDKDVSVKWSDIGLTGPATIRDLWSRKNVGSSAKGFTAHSVPIHGARLLKVTPTGGNTVTLNDDALRIGYSGAWTRNGGNEVAATSQPLTVAVSSTGTPKPSSGEGAVRTTVLNDTDSSITYEGSWSTSTNRGMGDYKDDVHYAEQNGAALSYTFQGTGISLITEKDESQGDVQIFIDGQLRETVDTSRPAGQPRQAQQTVYSVNDLPPGSHVFRAVKSSGQFMLVDRIDVIEPNLVSPNSVGFDTKAPADVTVELQRSGDELASVSLDGTALRAGRDYTLSGTTLALKKSYLATLPQGTSLLDVAFRGDYLDDVHSAEKNGASVSYAFRGTGVEWITAAARDQGKVDVYIDKRKVTTVDTSSTTRRTQQRAFGVDGLANGSHTITLVKVSGSVMRTDAIRYATR